MKIVIFDTETTSLRGEVIQLSLIILDKNFDIEVFDSFYCNTEEPISKGAFDVHGINNKMLLDLSKGEYLEDIIMKRYKDIFFGVGVVFIGFNVIFDIQRFRQTMLDHVGIEFNVTKSCNSLINLNKNYNYYLDLMMICRRKFNMVKGLNLTKAVELSISDMDIDAMYKFYSNKYGLSSTATYHDASYDTFCTYLLLLAHGNLIC